jgi:preprotein translocase subunit SecG
MSVLYIFLSLLMFLDCLLLVLLVLLQLPKKEAGAGMAFGGGATDALFGAGSGNVLTKITKYAGGAFFILAIVMAMVAARQNKTSGAEALTEALSKQAPLPAGAPLSLPAAAPAAAPSSNGGLQQMSLLSNLPPAQSSAPAAAPSGQATPPGTNK